MKLTDEQVRRFLNKVNIKIIEKGMTKTEFYAKSGISSALFSQWNTGANTPTEKSIAKVASALDTTVEYLFPELTGEGQKNTAHQTVDGFSDEDIRHLAAFRKADEETKAVIRRLLQQYAEGVEQ